MVSDDLKKEARKVWYEYGEAIKKAWRFPPTSKIVADGLDEVLATSTDESVARFCPLHTRPDHGSPTNEISSARTEGAS